MSSTPNANQNPNPNSNQSFNFNYLIAKFFLENRILTILVVILLVIFGIGSITLLKTTGFPSPVIKIAIVNTIYPQASSETIAKEVSSPLENAIKEVEGVKEISSTSSNNVSTIVVNIEESANVDTVRNKIDAAAKSVQLPVDAQEPKIVVPDIAGPDFIFAITSPDTQKLYQTYQDLEREIGQLGSTSKVTPFSGVEKKLVIKFKDNFAISGISTEQISTALSTVGESLPVVNNVEIDKTNKSIITSLKEEGLDEIKNLEFTPSNPTAQPATAPTNSNQRNLPVAPVVPAKVKLTDIAEVNLEYAFVDKTLNTFAYRSEDGNNVTTPAVFVSVKSVKNTDSGKYYEEIKQVIEKQKNKQSDLTFVDFESKIPDLNGKTGLVNVFSVTKQNKDQVDEVIGGLIGSPLKIDNQVLAQTGWILGGIQLVMLAMIAFVSWRAAIVAAAAIPLSLMFSTIYLYLVGENLNTLVLFSLVLVIGLVVDPALVVLEALQRKIDSGLQAKDAALAAIKDVGSGIFLAALTNIIVFAPFSILSGILGQIFRYIPLTIMPAIIGSYIVPLIVLTWLGSLILKRNKNAQDDEEANLWPIAKWLIAVNTKILHGSRLLRVAIIVGLLAFSFILTGAMFSTGAVKPVDFASSDNTPYLYLRGNFATSLTPTQKEEAIKDVLTLLGKEPKVKEILPIENGINFYLKLDQTDKSEKSKDTGNRLTNEIKQKYADKFFDISVDPVGNAGPSQSFYQAQISIRTNDFAKLEKASKEIGKLYSQLCVNQSNSFADNFDPNFKKLEIKADCDEDKKLVTKVDDGYTGKENKQIQLILDRQKITQAGAILPNVPFLTALVNVQVKNNYTLNNERNVPTVNLDNQKVDVLFEQDAKSPKTIEELKKFPIRTLTGQTVELQTLGSVVEAAPKETIERVEGQTIGTIAAQFNPKYSEDQATAALASTTVKNYLLENDAQKLKDLGLEKEDIGDFKKGESDNFAKSFQELLIALVLAILVSYVVLAVFFNSFTQPITIIYTVPLTFIGVFPALAAFVGGQFGFLEIIGLIILIGVVENVAIFLIDAANQKINEEGWDEKRAIAYAAGVRMRPVILTNLTAIASLAPLAIFSDFYRSISVVIIFGILVSGLISLVTTSILFVFFKWAGRKIAELSTIHKLGFYSWTFYPIYLLLSILFGFSIPFLGPILALLMLSPIVYLIVFALKK